MTDDQTSGDWLEAHPRTGGYIAVVVTLLLVINAVELAKELIG